MSERNNWVTLAAYEHLENDAISLRDLYHAQCREAAELTRQRDALLGACESLAYWEFLVKHHVHNNDADRADSDFREARAAIALVPAEPAKEVEGG